MAARKIMMQKKINSTMYEIHPKTDASIVYLASGMSVESKISTLESDLSTLQNTLVDLLNSINSSSIYLTENSQTLTDDEGTGLIAIY